MSETLDRVKVFSATMQRERDALGEAVTKWLCNNRAYRVANYEVRQSSDNAYHCLSIVLFLTKVEHDG